MPADAVSGQIVSLSVFATWLICEDVCIPEETTFSLNVPVHTAANPAVEISRAASETLFDAARKAMPLILDHAGRYGGDDTTFSLSIDLPEPTALPIRDAFFFAQDEGVLKPAGAQRMQVDNTTLLLTATPDFAFQSANGSPIKGVLTYADARNNLHAFEVNANPGLAVASVGLPAAQADGAGPVPGLPLLLIMAFFGGVILNIMPCVFPILFIKASSLMSSAAQDQGTVKAHGWLYTAGVVATFAAMGALLLLLRAQGERLGWGFHLQSPVMVLLSSYTLFLVGLNLAGVFHIGTSLQGVGQGLTTKNGSLGAFFTGMLAVVVAAPCIGPLLSAPMGAAVLLPPFWGMMIFVLMAFGLAAPYLLLSLIPSLGRLLPKPGAWMETFKQFLSFPVFAAAAYFLWVLAAQTGSAGLAVGFTGLLVLSVAAWLFECTKSGKWQLAGSVTAAVLLLAALAPLSTLKPATAIANEGGKHGSIASVAFDPAQIAELNGAGTGVFVDFTAAWCVTCQFNKLTVFSSDQLAQTFEQSGTVFMVADWTVRDPVITSELERFNRNGVPLYVFYPAKGEPVILPLPLTETAIVNAVSNL